MVKTFLFLLSINGCVHGYAYSYVNRFRSQNPNRRIFKPSDGVPCANPVFVKNILQNRYSRTHETTIVPFNGLRMGLYDEPLPPPPSDDFAEEYKKAKRDKQFQKWNPDGAENTEEQAQRPRLFIFNEKGEDQLGILPSLGRNPNIGIESYYEPSDSLVRQLLRMTRCHPDDACWALEAHKGKVMEASVSIALAQRQVLNDQVALPGEDEVAQTDWDSELSNLIQKQESAGGKGDLGKEFEESGYSVGLDGLEERQIFSKRREKKEEAKKWLEGGKPDQDWLPGGNPRPVDDEPWFTG